jgi:hypothetical protein
MEHITLITAIAGLVFGFLGAVLGFINTWRAISRDRVRLRIRPTWMIYPHGEPCLGIEVTNVGYIAATVSEVGITVSGGMKFVILPEIPLGSSLPQRMEPRTSITVVARPGTENAPPLKDGLRAYARTACGLMVTGTSPMLREIIDKARLAGR